MLYVYTTGDGLRFTAEDGTVLVLGGPVVNLFGLITDRVEADVTAVSELAEAIKHGTATEEQVQQYLNVHQKGAYTHEDLNRVEEAVQYVAYQLQTMGYMSALPRIGYWSVENKPNQADLDRYFGNVALIRSVLSTWESTPEAPTGVVGFDVNKANALEQILVDIDQILTYVKNAWFYASDLYAAEV